MRPTPLPISRHLSWLVSLALALGITAPLPALADSIGNGPLLLLGYSPDSDASGTSQDLAIVDLGWRWHFDGADCLDNFFAKAKTDFSWTVEPTIGGVFGDAEAFEASVVPFVHLAPLDWNHAVVPWFEGGIGLAYTGLRNYGLGSRVEFSDNAGIGITFGPAGGRRWSIGYRFRHMSHAGIFGSHNDGLNAHFLVITVE